MSFITQDKNLIKALLKIANNKYAQQTPPPDPIKNNQIITGLVNKLKRNLDNYTEGDFVSLRENSELNLVNLQSDYQLLLFLQQNGIMYEGQPLSVAHTPGLPDNRQGEQHYNKIQGLDKKLYVKYPKPKDGKGDDFRFWINKNGILEFLRSLYNRSKDTSAGGNLLKVLLDKLVIAINTNSGQPIDPTSKPAPKLPETTEIDKFPNPYELSDPGKQGDVILRLKDINNQDNFKGWLTRLPVTQNGTNLFAPANDENICKVLSPILQRAQYYVNFNINSDDPLTKQKFDFYYSQIKSFMNANNCNVNTNVPTTTEKPGGTGTDGDKESGDRKRTQQAMPEQNLDQLIRRLPLNMSIINFSAIREFFEYVEQYSYDSVDRQRYEQIKNRINSNITFYQSLLKPQADLTSFNLSANVAEFQSTLRESSNYSGALEKLMFIVGDTRNGIAYLQNKLGPGIREEYKSALASQVGQSATSGSSIAAQNLEVLSRLASDVSQAIKRTKGR